MCVAMVFIACCSLEHTSAVSKELMKLMMIPVDNYNDISTLLKLTHYSALFDYFDFEARRSLSLHIVNNALESGHYITTTEEVCVHPYLHSCVLSFDVHVSSVCSGGCPIDPLSSADHRSEGSA